MAKKKAPARRSQPKREARKGKAAKPAARPKKPVNVRRNSPHQTLPGMEDARIRPLDDIAAAIADCREQKNALATEEKGLQATALRLLKEHRKHSWKHAGVELIRVPGDEHLSIRLVRSGAANDNAPDEERGDREDLERQENPPDAGDDQDDDLDTLGPGEEE